MESASYILKYSNPIFSSSIQIFLDLTSVFLTLFALFSSFHYELGTFLFPLLYQSCIILIKDYYNIMNRLIGQVGREFANGLGDLSSIPGCVIPKTLKMVLDTSLLNTQQYKVLSRVKWRTPGKDVAPSPTPRCSSY